MIIIGLLNLYKITSDPNLLIVAEHMTNALIEKFFDGSKLVAVLDASYHQPPPKIMDTASDGSGAKKWSTISGAYHSKLSLALLELSRLTDNTSYTMIADSICNYAKGFQNSDGRFTTNPDSDDITYLHPHLYACEGLIFAGINRYNESYYTAGLRGIAWAMKQINPSSGGLPRDTGKNSSEQSDCTAQLLRLMILYRFQLQEYLKKISSFSSHTTQVDTAINRLHSRLLDFYISAGEDKGAMRYQLALKSACSWCTMFSMQALGLWKKRKDVKRQMTWLDCYI
jgi:hypothetical protein